MSKIIYDSPYLVHFGIFGMKWGQRRYQNEDGTLTEAGKARYKKIQEKEYKRMSKEAAKDAKEYARAKAYYGEGAGNRRKILKNKLSNKMKNPDYRKEFNRQLSLQDMEKHQKAANAERKVRDAGNFAVKTARGVKNFLLGNPVTIPLAAVAIGFGIKHGVHRKMAAWGRNTFNNAKMSFARMRGRVTINDWLNRMKG